MTIESNETTDSLQGPTTALSLDVDPPAEGDVDIWCVANVAPGTNDNAPVLYSVQIMLLGSSFLSFFGFLIPSLFIVQYTFCTTNPSHLLFVYVLGNLPERNGHAEEKATSKGG